MYYRTNGITQRENEQVEINMNIVKFLETMREDAGRCKREFEWLKQSTWSSNRCESAHPLALEMLGKYGGILEGVPSVSCFEENHPKEKDFLNLFSLLYGRLYSCVALRGAGMCNIRVIKPGWVEYTDKDDKLLSVLCRHPELGKSFSSAEIQKIRKGCKIILSVELNDGTTKRTEFTVTEFDEKMIKR